MHLQKWRAFFILSICIAGSLLVLPNFVSSEFLRNYWPSWAPQERINLGLDLQGGASILLEVDTKEAILDHLQNLSIELRRALRKESIGYTGLKVGADGLKVEIRDAGQLDMARKIVRKLDQGLDIQTTGQTLSISFTEAEVKRYKLAAVDQSIEIVRRRIDEMGTKEPLIQRQGDSQILVQLPGLTDPSEAKSLIGKTAKLTFHLEHAQNGLSGSDDRVPFGAIRVQEEERGGGSLLVSKEALLSGEMLTDAQALVDNEHGGWQVSFVLDAVGSRRFADVTTNNVGRRFAVLLDGKVITAPVIQSPIAGGRGVITGRFTAKDAQDLALLLRAGALPAPLSILEERLVGPDLGEDSVQAGKHATVIATVLVLLFMFLFYGLAYGGIANVALVFNLLLLLSALSLLQATLTLPGIAGIALTLGMAVDANVLIFERIKEELRQGRPVAASIDAGFNRAMSTIIDSNITTLIGAALLYQFGTGAVRGFAVTLALGILISMFTAVSVTRVFIVIAYKLVGDRALSFGFRGRP